MILLLFTEKTMGNSRAAWDPDQAELDRYHAQSYRGNEISLKKNTQKIVYDIIDMLWVAHIQSEMRSTQLTYIFLSRIDAILGHLTWGSENIIRQVAQKIDIPQDLVDIHIKWWLLMKQHEYLSRILNEWLSQIKQWQSDLPVWIQIKHLWKNGEKKKLFSIMTNVTQYQMYMRYFCIRTYGKDLKEFMKS
jgi:hypothetical protein